MNYIMAFKFINASSLSPKYSITPIILSSCWMAENAPFFVVCTKFLKCRKRIQFPQPLKIYHTNANFNDGVEGNN